MSKHLSMMALLATIGLTTACGSDQSAAGAGGAATGDAAGTSDVVDAGAIPSASFCMNGDNGVCVPRGFPFVHVAFPVTDWCAGVACLAPTPMGQNTIHFRQPEAGTLCLSGTVLPGTAFGAFNMLFVIASPDGTQILKTFNAEALGITQVAFTIDRPPTGGLFVNTGSIIRRECPGGYLPNCIMFGYELPVITESGPIVASFADFVPSSGMSVDARALSHLGFTVTEPGTYDFCLRDFRFLNANGEEVPEPVAR